MITPIVATGKETLEQLYEMGKRYALEACDAWNIALPPRFQLLLKKTQTRAYAGLYTYGAMNIQVDLKLNSKAFDEYHVGGIHDCTPTGTVAHEFGHFIENIKKLEVFWKLVLANEPAVSEYEPNVHEAFAEAFRIFMLNPDLLRLVRPIRYAYIVNQMKLKPLHNLSWREVLIHARPEVIDSVMENMI